MKKTMIIIASITAIFAILFVNIGPVWAAITCGTIAYHFWMRLLIGLLFDAFMKNRADYTKRWYQLHRWESGFYKVIHVRQWKRWMPSFEPELFDPARHTWSEIAQAMCQAELVHETIVLLSFVPIAAAIWFEALPVFVITSVAAAVLDLVFVILQRYNRPRVIRLIDRQDGRHQHKLG